MGGTVHSRPTGGFWQVVQEAKRLRPNGNQRSDTEWIA